MEIFGQVRYYKCGITRIASIIEYNGICFVERLDKNVTQDDFFVQNETIWWTASRPDILADSSKVKKYLE